MTNDPSRRPSHLTPPAHLSPNPPVPAPAEPQPTADPDGPLSPVRYGDWERKGIAVDF
ncbi:DUF1674 domain-containing protein [Sphingomonas nostoxanthinifaciens]|uniref:DUF1674 domain-containing protein n=1 Tax=Sphingomonas nostoxanthinifaciens TaxID=2872652 RepID=UPI001CC21219|nr:DUF1674 domain-containing protein [Sphingomonas nostoxanthinifaciens]UAK24545.1 DUF1674 domain-containing protein [Sphingomonas nostoxanthinifaciens]